MLSRNNSNIVSLILLQIEIFELNMTGQAIGELYLIEPTKVKVLVPENFIAVMYYHITYCM